MHRCICIYIHLHIYNNISIYLRRLPGPHEGVWRVEHCHHREDLVGAGQLRRVEEHLGQLWVERELGHHGAELGQGALFTRNRVGVSPVYI